MFKHFKKRVLVYKTSNRKIFFGVFPVLLPKGFAVGAHGSERFMDIHTVVRGINETSRNIGAMVGGALKVGQEIRPHKARLHTTVLLLQAQNVPCTHVVL